MANLSNTSEFMSKGERIGEKDFKGMYQGRDITIREMEFTKENMEMVVLEVENHQKCDLGKNRFSGSRIFYYAVSEFANGSLLFGFLGTF
ncbi:unnamed protein product [Microthlaspi erraticum]|uniref:Uncharacterized protein n=1 Tax=Microthlaspi erraticum TaxID=1685480 RepID=A0A6D2JHS5_9BRAS|nr:unnamed protein product [Microthlaspi erraticum]